MSLWMMKCEIEGHLGVDPNLPELVFRHPTNTYRVHVRNHRMEAGSEKPLLIASVDTQNRQLIDTSKPTIN